MSSPNAKLLAWAKRNPEAVTALLDGTAAVVPIQEPRTGSVLMAHAGVPSGGSFRVLECADREHMVLRLDKIIR